MTAEQMRAGESGRDLECLKVSFQVSGIRTREESRTSARLHSK